MTCESNLIRLNNLLEEGFSITEIAFHFEKGVLSTTVKLAKGKQQEEIVSVNESAFFKHINHFKRVRDAYGNDSFKHFENIEEYNRLVGKLPVLQGPESRAHYIKAGDRVLDKDIIIDFLQKPGPGVQVAKAQFGIVISSNPDFENVDLRDEVSILLKNTNEIVFKGHVIEVAYGEDFARFVCQVGPRKFGMEKISFEYMNVPHVDMLYFLAKVGGLTPQIGPPLKPNLTSREFVVIVPVQNLIIADSFSVGGVEFYPLHVTHDDFIIRKSKTGRADPDWVVDFPRARCVVKSTNWFDAMMEGYDKISRAIDWIAFRTDLTLPMIREGERKRLVYFNKIKHFSRVKIPTKVYCREKGSEHTCFFDLSAVVESTLCLEHDPEEFFLPTKKLFEPVFMKKESDLNLEEKSVLFSLRWLRRAIQLGDNKDKLLDLWNALEFTIGGVQPTKRFSDDEIKKISEFVDQLGLKEKQAEILTKKVGELNDAPLRERIKMFLEESKVSLTQSEWSTIGKTRTKRNNIIHGLKDEPVLDEEVEKLRSLIEKMLLAKINSLYQKPLSNQSI